MREAGSSCSWVSSLLLLLRGDIASGMLKISESHYLFITYYVPCTVGGIFDFHTDSTLAWYSHFTLMTWRFREV